MSRKIGWMLVGIFCLVLVPLRAGAQETQWKKHMAFAAKAHQQGNYGDAEKSFKAALEEAEHFEPQDTRLAINLHNLAELYRLQAKYTKAEPVFKRALAVWEKALGPDHPHVATSLNNLAALYNVQGRYFEAEPLFRRALAIRAKVLGPDHPQVATSLENYAALLLNMNRKAEATGLQALSEAIRVKHTQENSSK